MRLYKISGKLWELTPFQETYSAENITSDLFQEVTKNTLLNKDSKRGCIRIYNDRKIRSKAKAIIEFSPIEHLEYTVYFDKKGFYSSIKGRKIYLDDLLDENTLIEE